MEIKIFALVMLFCIFAALHHVTNWLFRKKDIEIVGLLTAIISAGVAIVIYHASYEVKEELVRDPSQYQMVASDSGYTFYDYDRRVGFIPIGNSKLDTLIWNDNQ